MNNPDPNLMRLAGDTVQAGLLMVNNYSLYTESLEVYKPAVLTCLASLLEALEGIFSVLSLSQLEKEKPEIDVDLQDRELLIKVSLFLQACAKQLKRKSNDAKYVCPFILMHVKASTLKNDVSDLAELQ